MHSAEACNMSYNRFIVAIVFYSDGLPWWTVPYDLQHVQIHTTEAFLWKSNIKNFLIYPFSHAEWCEYWGSFCLIFSLQQRPQKHWVSIKQQHWVFSVVKICNAKKCKRCIENLVKWLLFWPELKRNCHSEILLSESEQLKLQLNWYKK